MNFHNGAAIVAVVAMVLAATPSHAQDAVTVQEATPAAMAETPPNPEPATHFLDSGSPFGASLVTNADAAAIRMPVLAYKPDPLLAEDFDKYYAFHRADTDFATAYADIAECDGYARGLQSGIAYQQAPYPYTYTMVGAVGGAIGNAMVIAIFGSAEKRRLRRVNMRACMGYKGYDRYGLPKNVWDDFNFEEGLSAISEDKRQAFLKQQALVASSGTLQGEVLGL